jgi:hypothetical protein
MAYRDPATRRAWARRTGAERRVGARAAQKRQADYVSCPRCNGRMGRGSRLCAQCRAVTVAAFEATILQMRASGLTNREIAVRVESTANRVAQTFSKMRHAGVNVPVAPYFKRGR